MDVWLDEQNLVSGDDLDAILDAISQADAAVVVLTRASAGAPWVESEVNHARALGKRVVCVRLEDLPPGSSPHWSDDLSFVDFRRPREYRRATHSVLRALEGLEPSAAYLSAKDAVAMVRRTRYPHGDLVGVSQQGVSLMVERALSDWEHADVLTGLSRFWVVEHAEPSEGRLAVHCVVDGRVEDLPDYRIATVHPLPSDATLVRSCALGPGTFDPDAAKQLAADHGTQIERFVAYPPPPILSSYIDSVEAIRRAESVVFGVGNGSRVPPDLLTLASLRIDTGSNAARWRVGFFDPTLTREIHAVEVDAEGHGSHIVEPGMMLNVPFVGGTRDAATGDVILDAYGFLRASRARGGALTGARLHAADCYEAARSSLQDAHPGIWQVLAISNTGAFEGVTHVHSGEDALLDGQGRAGQWVFEFVSGEGEPVREGDRVGTEYSYCWAVVTFRGEVAVTRETRNVVLTVPLTPLRDEAALVNEFGRAFLVARSHVDRPFDQASVVLLRGTNTNWHFRFYAGGELTFRVSLGGPQLLLVDRQGL